MRRLNGDSGAVAVMVALLAVVIFGFAALAIDAGAIYAERRTLQNGADAGAFAVARACTSSSCPTTGDTNDMVQQYARLNDGQQTSDVAQASFCGSGSDPWPDCSPAPAVPPGVSYIRVTDRPLRTQSDGTTSDRLPAVLANILPGTPSGTYVDASATVAWGYGTKSTGPTLPFIMSVCEWKSFAPPGGKGPAPTPPLPLGSPVYPAGVPWQYEDTIDTQGSGGNCNFNPSGQTGAEAPVSGNFGWVEVTNNGANSDCVAAVDATNTSVTAKPGAQACVKNWLDLHLGTVVDIPVYYTNPVSGTYSIGGWTPFFITGYRLSEAAMGDYNDKYATDVPREPIAKPNCLAVNTGKCITGFPVNMPAGDGPIFGPSFGLGSTTTSLLE